MAGANPALDAALALARTPTLASPMRRQPLPAGVADLLRILAGDEGVTSQAAAVRGVDERRLRFAVEAYVQQVMLFPNAAAHRVLGVGPDASREEMRRHLRWLMNWLHPDHNQTDWRSGFAARVLAAWRELSSRTQGKPGAEGPQALSAGSAPSVQRRSAPSLQKTWRRPPRIAWVARPVAPPPRSLRRVPRSLGWVIALLVFLYTVAVPGPSPSDLWAALRSPSQERFADIAPASADEVEPLNLRVGQ